MDRKQMCVANVQYKKPSADGAKQSKNLLRYLTYRESRTEKAQFVAGRERWVDRGMGGSVAEIAQRCDDLKSQHVLTFSLVVNPNPDLIGMVAPDERERFVRELTERVVDDFFEARGLDTGIEWSAVMHHRQTDDRQSPGQHNPHTHIVLPGTVYDEEHGGRVPLFFSRNQKVNHIEMLHNVTEQVMAEQMERYVGPEWEQRYDDLAAIREYQREIVTEVPHGYEQDADNSEIEWAVWCGVRRTDEHTTAVGYYRHYTAPTDDDPEAVQLEFRPLLAGLTHEEAELLARAFAVEMNGDMGSLKQLAEWVGGMSTTERRTLIEELQRDDRQRPAPDIDF